MTRRSGAEAGILAAAGIVHREAVKRVTTRSETRTPAAAESRPFQWADDATAAPAAKPADDGLIVRFSQASPCAPGKLADAELHFTAGILAGLKLIGFSVWERRGGSGRNITFPARQYAVNGERRSFALLRPIADVLAQERIRARILEAFDAWEKAQ